jgi:hypothetical protein
MKTVLGVLFVAMLAVPAAAFEGCASKSQAVVSTTPATPVQTAEAPSTSQTK